MSKKAFSQERWESTDSYGSTWPARAREMSQMLVRSDINLQTLSVLGCGPHRSFEAVLMECEEKYSIESYDLKAWDSDVKLLNLEKQNNFKGVKADCAIAAGVLEYTDIKNAFNNCSSSFKFMLFSYVHVSQECCNCELDYVRAIKKRIVSGYRNHLTINQLLRQVSDFGYVMDLELSETFKNQYYILMRFHEAAAAE